MNNKKTEQDNFEIIIKQKRNLSFKLKQISGKDLKRQLNGI